MSNGIFKLRDQILGLVQKAWTGSQKTPAVEYLVVAGGGSGNYTGGGGAGGLLQGVVNVPTGTALTVTVGNGGTGNSSGSGNSGGNSVFYNITANGGGVGVTNYTAFNSTSGSNGGSGGGGASIDSISTSESPNTPGLGIIGQGHSGGTGICNTGSSLFLGGGGGGAGASGLPAIQNHQPGDGGSGVASAISGTVTTYAGGGGGGSIYFTGVGASGGVGGGGAGGTGSGNGTNGTVNTGGGGGSGSYNGSNGNNGNGGSGIVIISYPDIYAAPTFGGANSPTASTSGSGSFAPSNTSSWINYNGQSNLQFGTGDFTIELWVYFTSTSGTNYLVDFRGWTNPTGSSFGFYQNSSGLQLFNNSTTINYGAVTTNTWYNVVWSRTSGVTYFFVNGTLVNSGGTTDTANYTAGTNAPTFGGSSYNLYSNGNTFGLQGYMSNVRVLKGTGLYTSNFTPSTKPLTAITNTSLLLNTVSGAYLADGSTNANAATVQGTVSWNQASPFATGLGYKNRVYTWTGNGTVTF